MATLTANAFGLDGTALDEQNPQGQPLNYSITQGIFPYDVTAKSERDADDQNAPEETDDSTEFFHPSFETDLDNGVTERGGEPYKPGIKQYAIDTGKLYGYVWITRLFYVRNKNSRIFDTSPSKWWDNISKAPVKNDGDNYVTNFINHPLFGAYFYLYYRERGHGVMGSFLGSAIMSTLFEYTVEGLVETPSLSDLLATPGIGTPIGMGMETVSNWLFKRDNGAATVLAYVINPLKLVIHGSDTVLLNPLTGTFAFSGPFELPANKAEALRYAYPLFTESPQPMGRVTARLEIVTLKDKLGNGQFIFYSARGDFASKSGLYGLYIQVPYSGVNNVRLDGEKISSGFELGNILIGNKVVLQKTKNSIMSAGFDFYLPTIRKDNENRLKTITHFTRELPSFLRDSFTLSPYLAAAASRGWIVGQAIWGNDFILNADRLEGDFFEYRARYGLNVSAQPENTMHTVLFTEVNNYNLATASEFKKNDLFVTWGARFGGEYSPGVALQLPLAGQSDEVADVELIFDLQLRF